MEPVVCQQYLPKSVQRRDGQFTTELLQSTSVLESLASSWVILGVPRPGLREDPGPMVDAPTT
jgi:hypothetical protein